MFGHEKQMINGNGSLSSQGNAVGGVNQAGLPSSSSPPVLTTSVTTSASTSTAAAVAAAATSTPVGASNSSAPAGMSNGMNGTNQNANNHRGPDSSKRRKSKSRNTAVPNTSTYSREHLNAWLETCLKDASSTQLSSSSEFLDYNPSKSFQSNQKPPMQQQPQRQQQHQQQQQNLFNQQFKNQFKKQQFHQLFDLPRPPSYTSNAFNPAFHMNNPYAFNPINNLLQHTDGSVEFASLPPIVNILGSENENNSADVLDGSSSNPNMSRGFRFSDPCLLNPSDNDSKVSGQNTPDRRNNYTTPGGNMENNNNKFFAALMEQINMLHETNTKICRNLHETKVEIEALKHAPNWGLRHRRDSLSGLSTHSQPLGFGFGTQSPAPTYHSGAYTPGMMTDVVREVKESARVREDALLSRVKAMVEERSWSMGEENLRMLRDIEDLKSQVQHLKADNKETNKRLLRLETDNKYMRQMLATILNKRIPDIMQDKEVPRQAVQQQQRKNFPNLRQPKRANSLNLHYGVIHQATEEEEPINTLHIAEQSSVGGGALNSMDSSDQRHSFSSSDGQTSIVNSTAKNGWPEERSSLKRPPKTTVVQDDTLELQKELQEALAARKEADNRIIALENMVKKLQVKFPNGGDEQITKNIISGTGGGGVGGGSCNASAAAPAYSSFLLSSTPSMSSSPSSSAPKTNHNNSAINSAPTASSSSSASQMFHSNNSSNQMQQQQQQHLQQQHQQQQNHLPPKLSLAGPITDL